MVLRIELLDGSRHNRLNFDCTKDSLNHYLHRQASQDVKKRVSTVFVLIDEPNKDVLAYYTLSSYTIDIAVLDKSSAKGLPRYPQLPATLLGRLAVDNKQQGRGLGELVLMDALERALSNSKQVASLAVVVDALDEKAVDFYKRYGFGQFKQESMKLYISMQTIEKL